MNTELYFENDALGKQVSYANRKGIPYVLILGPDELAAGLVTLRDLVAKQQMTVPRDQAAAQIQTWQAGM